MELLRQNRGPTITALVLVGRVWMAVRWRGNALHWRVVRDPAASEAKRRG